MSEVSELRLTPFEHYMLADDRAGHPMRFCFRLGFQGMLDLPRLTQSFAVARNEQPLLTARIARRRGSWIWALPDGSSNGSQPRQSDSPFNWNFDLRRESGVRFSLEPRGGDCDLWLLVHHSCADARAAVSFLARWFDHYEGRVTSPVSKSGVSQIVDLQRRDLGRRRSLWPYAFPIGKRWSRLWKFYGRRPSPLTGSDAALNEAQSSDSPAYVSRRLHIDNARWRELKSRLPTGVTLNDLLLAATFLAICQWNERASNGARRQWLRLAVPMDLATANDRRTVVANYVGMVFLDRRSDHVFRHAELLTGIHQEMQWIKQHGIGFAILDVLRILDRIPFGMRAGVASTACMSTAVVSNLGPICSLLPNNDGLTLGQARLKEIDFLVPIRPGTTASFGILTHADQLHLAMNYDRRRLTATDAGNILDLLCALVDNSLHSDPNKNTWTHGRE